MNHSFESELGHSVQYLSFMAGRNLGKCLSHFRCFKMNTEDEKLRALLALADSAHFLKTLVARGRRNCYQGHLGNTIEHLVSTKLGSFFPNFPCSTSQRGNYASSCQKANVLKKTINSGSTIWELGRRWVENVVRERNSELLPVLCKEQAFGKNKTLQENSMTACTWNMTSEELQGPWVFAMRKKRCTETDSGIQRSMRRDCSSENTSEEQWVR